MLHSPPTKFWQNNTALQPQKTPASYLGIGTMRYVYPMCCTTAETHELRNGALARKSRLVFSHKALFLCAGAWLLHTLSAEHQNLVLPRRIQVAVRFLCRLKTVCVQVLLKENPHNRSGGRSQYLCFSFKSVFFEIQEYRGWAGQRGGRSVEQSPFRKHFGPGWGGRVADTQKQH